MTTTPNQAPTQGTAPHVTAAAFLVPKLRLGTHLSAKLCFGGVDHAGAPRANAAAGKQSFQDKGVPKRSLGTKGVAELEVARRLCTSPE
jgi:hypothetical protein